MKMVFFRFYEELNNYLSADRQKGRLESQFEKNTSVGDQIQSLGIPLDQIDLILVNGHSKSFDYLLQEDDRISVYPVFESFDISEITQLREKPLRNPRFICDVHLGRLCKYLRMLGWDTLYSNQYTDKEMIALSVTEKRILLSKSSQLTRHRKLTHAYWIRSSEPLDQLKDLVNHLDLSRLADPLTRCLNCNELLIPVEKSEIIHLLEERTATYYTEFFLCRSCQQIYWKGSHYENMLSFIEQHVQNNHPIQ